MGKKQLGASGAGDLVEGWAMGKSRAGGGLGSSELSGEKRF